MIKAKTLTLVIIAVVFVVGCIGAFVPTFQMEGFTAFVKAITPCMVTLYTSIGVSAVVDKVKEKKCVEEDQRLD